MRRLQARTTAAVTIVPISRPPSILALMIPTMIGKPIGMSAGASIDLMADPVTMPTARL